MADQENSKERGKKVIIQLKGGIGQYYFEYTGIHQVLSIFSVSALFGVNRRKGKLAGAPIATEGRTEK